MTPCTCTTQAHSMMMDLSLTAVSREANPSPSPWELAGLSRDGIRDWWGCVWGRRGDLSYLLIWDMGLEVLLPRWELHLIGWLIMVQIIFFILDSCRFCIGFWSGIAENRKKGRIVTIFFIFWNKLDGCLNVHLRIQFLLLDECLCMKFPISIGIEYLVI